MLCVKEVVDKPFPRLILAALLLAATIIVLGAANTEALAGNGVMANGTPVGTVADDMSIIVEEESLALETPPVMVANHTFVPVRDFAQGLGVRLIFYKDVAVTLRNGDFEVTLRVDNPAAVINGTVEMIEDVPFITYQRIYVPLRLTAEALGFAVGWDGESQAVQITEVVADDAAASVVTALWDPVPGQDSSQVSQEPRVSYDDEEFELLVRVINAEAYNEPQEGRIAVGNVIVNRVLHHKFPDTIRDVLLAPGQFHVFDNGQVNRAIRPESYEAAREALYGLDRSKGALYFFNPAVSNSGFWRQRPITAEIGGHRFTR